MKRYIILTILSILPVVPAMAQKDLSELNGMTDDQVKKTYGQPKEYTANHEYTMSSYFRYDDMEIFYTQSHKSIDCGSAEKNSALAIARAESIANLVMTRGVPEERIEIRSVGGITACESIPANRNCRIELFFQ